MLLPPPPTIDEVAPPAEEFRSRKFREGMRDGEYIVGVDPASVEGDRTVYAPAQEGQRVDSTPPAGSPSAEVPPTPAKPPQRRRWRPLAEVMAVSIEQVRREAHVPPRRQDAVDAGRGSAARCDAEYARQLSAALREERQAAIDAARERCARYEEGEPNV